MTSSPVAVAIGSILLLFLQGKQHLLSELVLPPLCSSTTVQNFCRSYLSWTVVTRKRVWFHFDVRLGKCIWEELGGRCRIQRSQGSGPGHESTFSITSLGSACPFLAGELSTSSQIKPQGRSHPTWLEGLSAFWFLLSSFCPPSHHWTGREEGEGGSPNPIQVQFEEVFREKI